MKKTLTTIAFAAIASSAFAQTTIEFNEPGYTDGLLQGQNTWIDQGNSLADTAGAGVVVLNTTTNWRGAMYGQAYNANASFTVDFDFSFTEVEGLTNGYTGGNKDIFGFLISDDHTTSADWRTALRRTATGYTFFTKSDATNTGGAFLATAIGLDGSDGDTSDLLNLSLTVSKNLDATADNWDFTVVLTNLDGASPGVVSTHSATLVSTILTDATSTLFGGFTSSLATGHFVSDREQFNYTITGTAVPEPSTYALLAGVLAMTAVMVRRRK